MKNKKAVEAKKGRVKEIRDYDDRDTSAIASQSSSLKFEALGLKLPEAPPTQVISIRLPTELLNELKALGSEQDVPYQALIKLFLRESVDKTKKKRSA